MMSLSSSLALVVVQALLIVALSRLVGLAIRPLRQPMVIAEIAAGIALGPSLLGRLFPSLEAAIFPARATPTLGIVSQFGLIVFMFTIGVEFDPKLLRGRGKASVLISHTSIIVPFALGALLARLLYSRLSPPGVPLTSFTLFLGAAMSITAFPVLARILAERRLIDTKVGGLALACAAVDDVTAWCILAFVVAVVRAAGVAPALVTTALTLIYVAALVRVGRPMLERLAVRATRTGELSENYLAVIWSLALLSAALTEWMGIHALFGAFTFGAVIPNTNGFARMIAERTGKLVVVLLLPLFFAYSGLRTQIGLLQTAEDWWICGAVLFVACAGKFGGTALAARLSGMSMREASVLGLLMNTRGLMELIILNIGLDLGVISPKLFGMMVLMALVTTFITTPLLQWIRPESEEWGTAPAAPDGLVDGLRRVA